MVGRGGMILPHDQQAAEPNGARRPRICLAASGGGHLRQLLDLSPAWSAFDHFFVTEDTALGRSLPGRVHFVPHFALGQGRLGKPGRMLFAAVRNFFRSAMIILGERPDIVVTTGAGSMVFVVAWARLVGARVILIETFARFRRLSAFARSAGRLAHEKIVQAAALRAEWPDALVFDPLRVLDDRAPPKEPLLFATVGATLPFPRLVASVAALKLRGDINDQVIIQRGEHGAAPDEVTSFETASFAEMLTYMRRARIVVCHGGTGSLITALREGCHVIAMPRSFGAGEHYDDHQSEIVEAFRDRGLIQIAHTEEELAAALRRVADRLPVVATVDHSRLIEHLKDDLDRFTTP
jgi:UDP-N-acetylglucosamine--N-acetylmuramyl-(pentapeptide) pyrophosphoryl-undecaprenol N-acetylglucosamine transferase